MMAGFAAGVTEALCIVTPFEVVKIRLQQQKGLAKDKLLYKVSLPHPTRSPALPCLPPSSHGPRASPNKLRHQDPDLAAVCSHN